MVKFLLFLFLSATTTFSFSQNTSTEFKRVHILDASALEKSITANRTKGLSAFHNVKVLYTLTTSSVKISPTETIQLLSSIKKIKGVIDCFFDSKSFMLYVKTEKEVNYVRIEQLKEALKANSKLQIENYKEELYSIE